MIATACFQVSKQRCRLAELEFILQFLQETNFLGLDPVAHRYNPLLREFAPVLEPVRIIEPSSMLADHVTKPLCTSDVFVLLRCRLMFIISKVNRFITLRLFYDHFIWLHILRRIEVAKCQIRNTKYWREILNAFLHSIISRILKTTA